MGTRLPPGPPGLAAPPGGDRPSFEKRLLGRLDDAVAAYDRAIELAGNATEREFLVGRRDSIAERDTP